MFLSFCLLYHLGLVDGGGMWADRSGCGLCLGLRVSVVLNLGNDSTGSSFLLFLNVSRTFWCKRWAPSQWLLQTLKYKNRKSSALKYRELSLTLRVQKIQNPDDADDCLGWCRLFQDMDESKHPQNYCFRGLIPRQNRSLVTVFSSTRLLHTLIRFYQFEAAYFTVIVWKWYQKILFFRVILKHGSSATGPSAKWI